MPWHSPILIKNLGSWVTISKFTFLFGRRALVLSEVLPSPSSEIQR